MDLNRSTGSRQRNDYYLFALPEKTKTLFDERYKALRYIGDVMPVDGTDGSYLRFN